MTTKAKGAPAPESAQQLQEYTLPIAHEHAGVQYQAGDTLSLYPRQIKRIERAAARRAAESTTQ